MLNYKQMPNQTLQSNVIYSGKIVTLTEELVELENGSQSMRELVSHRPVVAAVPVTANREIILVSQFRHPMKQHLLEIPAGGLNPNESPLDGAKRELLEETGIQAETWSDIASCYPSPGFCDEYIYIYLATNLSQQPPNPDDDEFITVQHIPIDQVSDLIASKKIIDAKTIIGCLHVLHIDKLNA